MLHRRKQLTKGILGFFLTPVIDLAYTMADIAVYLLKVGFACAAIGYILMSYKPVERAQGIFSQAGTVADRGFSLVKEVKKLNPFD